METPDPYTTRDRGFTLIELLVVIVILGILSAIVVFSVNGITNRGERSACEANVETVNIASEAYRAQNTGYALTLPALQSAGFLKTIPGTMAGDGLSFSVPEGGYTVTYDPLSGLASAGCAAAGGGGGTTTTTTAGGGGGGGTTTTAGGGGGGGGTTTTAGGGGGTTTTVPAATTTAVPCTYASYTPTSVNVGGGGSISSGTTLQLNLNGTCTGVTGVTAYVDRDDNNSFNSGDTLPMTVVSGSSNRTWRVTLPTSGWNDNETIDVRFTFSGTGAPATVNTSMVTD